MGGKKGIWIEQTKGAKFWLKVTNELKNRSVQDVLRWRAAMSTGSTIRDRFARI